MKRSRFTENRIIQILKEAGISLADLCRKHCFSKSSYYKWKAKYGGLEASDFQRLRELEAENISHFLAVISPHYPRLTAVWYKAHAAAKPPCVGRACRAGRSGLWSPDWRDRPFSAR